MKKLMIIALIGGWSAFVNAQNIDKIKKTIDVAYLSNLYMYCHEHPELSFHEVKTAERMADELGKLGFVVTTNVGGPGVVGVFKNGQGPTILVRTDMDALPIVEETGKPYASTVKTTNDLGVEVGVMHACGHDMHMTVWVGTAKALVKLKDEWKGTLVFIGQPAEERSGGSNKMLEDGLYTRFPKPDKAISLHVHPGLKAGTIGYCSGYCMANVDMMDITVHGKGGHGAYPHLGKDPIVLSAKIIMALQTIVSREISPLEPAVVTVGSIHGGTKGNVIPDDVELELTLRSYTDEVRDALIAKIHRICEGEAMAAGIAKEDYPTINIREEYTPALYNDPGMVKSLNETFKKAVGAENVIEIDPVMGGEDFARYGRTDDKIPVFMFRLGVVEASQYEAAQRGEINLPSLHSSKLTPDPVPSIEGGVTAMTAAVMYLLAH